MSKRHKQPERPAAPQPARPLRISVITPSFNTGDAIERAIQSVLAQDYPHFEHWIMDGASTDGTLDILRRHPHLKWVSEPDKGQSDAMNKGFQRATGEIIVYLNADDLLAEGAFSAVIPHFQQGAQVVMGRVRVIQEGNATDWINDPRTDVASMLRHWEPDAFCVNPVGYYYRREVQEAVPFNLANDDKMDLEFLLGVAARFPVVKVDRELGTFFYAARCKTGQEQVRLDYWREENFPFLEPFVALLPADEQERFRRRQATGYQVRRGWTVQALLNNLPALDAACRSGALMPLPADERAIDPSGVVDDAHWLADGDAVVAVLAGAGDRLEPVAKRLRELPASVAPFPVYLLPGTADDATTCALRAAFAQHRERLRWRFIGTPASREFLDEAFGAAFAPAEGPVLGDDRISLLLLPAGRQRAAALDALVSDFLGIATPSTRD